MFFMFVCSFICFCCLAGVFGDEVKSVSVMEGESVTLHNNDTDIEIAYLILWTFGPQETLIAKINKAANKTSVFDDVHDGMFKDRLQVDNQTLTITNTRTEDSGLYTMIIKSMSETSYRFNVTVYAERQTQLTFTDKTLVSCAAVGSLIFVATFLIFCICKKHTNSQQGSSDRSGDHVCTANIL